MSPLKRKKLSKIRLDLDRLDNSLIKLIKKRTNLVKQVLKLKDKKSQIVDQKRIKTILKNIRKKSIKNKIDPIITNKIWKNMISAYIDFEKRNFKKKMTTCYEEAVSFRQKPRVYVLLDYIFLT